MTYEEFLIKIEALKIDIVKSKSKDEKDTIEMRRNYLGDCNDRFVNFEHIIKSLFPNISLEQYILLYNQCVDFDYDTSIGYYDEVEYYFTWKVHLPKFYGLLKEQGLV